MVTQTSAIDRGERTHAATFISTKRASEHRGHERVRNYNGSWTEWGSSVRLPIER